MEFRDFIRVALAENLIDNDQYLLLVEQGDLRHAGELGEVDPRTLEAQRIIVGVNDFRDAVDKLEPIEKEQLLLKAKIEEPVVRVGEAATLPGVDFDVPVIGTTPNELRETLRLEFQLLDDRIKELNQAGSVIEAEQERIRQQWQQWDDIAAKANALEVYQERGAEIEKLRDDAKQLADELGAIHTSCQAQLDELKTVVSDARAILGDLDATATKASGKKGR